MDWQGNDSQVVGDHLRISGGSCQIYSSLTFQFFNPVGISGYSEIMDAQKLIELLGKNGRKQEGGLTR